ncbi:MAG TPA: DNA polymerase III subunit delta [Gemmatimonadaceae bacterium]
MPPAPDRAFWKSLQARSFESVYYLYGEDDFLKEHAVRQLIASAVDPATRDFNLDVRSAAELDAETLSSLVSTPPMMAERRVVVIRDVAALKKDARAALDRYLERAARTSAQSADIVLVLVASGGEKAKVDRTLEHVGLAVEFQPLTGDRVPKWIAHHVSTELGGSITPEAAELLQNAVGSDLPALAAELDKLVSYTSGAEIGDEAVSAVVGVRRGETLGDFLDSVAARDAARALAMLHHVLEQPKTTGVSIVMALTTQTLALAWGEVLRRERGTPPARLEGEFFALLKSASSAYTGRAWGEAVKAWARAVDRWDAASLDAALAALLAADIALKETRVSSDEQILTTLVLALCTGATRASRSTAPRRRVGAMA